MNSLRTDNSLTRGRDIRVCHVIDSLRRDGAQTALVNLVTGLADRRYNQRVFCLNDVASADVVNMLTDAGAEVAIVGKLKLLTTSGLAEIFVEMKRWRPHIVQTFLPYADTIGRTLARLAQVPIIVSSIRTRNVDKRFWQLLLDRITARWATKVVFNCKDAIPFALAREGVRKEQVIYIPNGVRTLVQERLDSRADACSRVGVSPLSRIVGTVGRLYPQKGHKFLINAFARVQAELGDAELLIVGKGPLLPNLREEAARLGVAGRVRFLGERSDVPLLLSCMDVYVQASLFEGMPNAVMEAMAAGRPVIATSVDGSRELVKHGETGWLVEPANSDQLATRILDVLKNSVQAHRVGSAAADFMRREFSIERMVSAFDHLYRSLVSSVLLPSHHNLTASGG